MIIVRNDEYVEWQGTEAEFLATSLPIKGWTEYTGDWPIPQPEPPVIIPESVSMRQARLILLQYGILAQIDAAVKTLGGAAEIEWEYASEVRRDNPLVGAMGLSESELDAMFLAASQL